MNSSIFSFVSSPICPNLSLNVSIIVFGKSNLGILSNLILIISNNLSIPNFDE